MLNKNKYRYIINILLSRFALPEQKYQKFGRENANNKFINKINFENQFLNIIKYIKNYILTAQCQNKNIFLKKN